MIIDCHNHVLASGPDDGYVRFMRHLKGPSLQAAGVLPDDRELTDGDWDELRYLGSSTPPERLIQAHRDIGVDLCAVLAVAPSDYTIYGQRGTVDLEGRFGVSGEPSIEKANDYISAVVRHYPDDLVGIAAVNPRFRGVGAAVQELERATTELGLRGVKLYPMYDHWSVEDPELAVPIFETADRLGIPVMVHMGMTNARGAILQYGRPDLLDTVAQRFPALRILVCHGGFPWHNETLVLAARHPNVYLDVSGMLEWMTAGQLLEFLVRGRLMGCPLSRVCFGSDNPPPNQLLLTIAKFVVACTQHGDHPPISRRDIARMLGGNFARFLGLEWDLDRALAQLDHWEPTWRSSWNESLVRHDDGENA